MIAWHRIDPQRRRVTLNVHVQPNAAVNAGAGRHGDALKIRIAAPAVEDKANRALIAFLQQTLRIRTAQISIRHGARGRRKTVEITEADDALVGRVAALMPD